MGRGAARAEATYEGSVAAGVILRENGEHEIETRRSESHDEGQVRLGANARRGGVS